MVRSRGGPLGRPREQGLLLFGRLRRRYTGRRKQFPLGTAVLDLALRLIGIDRHRSKIPDPRDASDDGFGNGSFYGTIRTAGGNKPLDEAQSGGTVHDYGVYHP